MMFYRQKQIKRLFDRWLPLLDRLWVRLSLAFSAVAFLSVASILVAIMLGLFATNGDRLTILDALQRPGGTVDALTRYYQARGSWQHVDVFLQGVQSNHPITPQHSVSFAFTDAEGNVLFNAHPTVRDPATVVDVEEDLPITSGGAVVGRLNVMHIYIPGAGDWQQLFLDWLTERLWLIALAGGTVGVLAGIWMSRSLAAPLSQLSKTAKAIGARRWPQNRVDLGGTAEVSEMAEAFNQMIANLQEAETLRRHMVADVAHELRTPLTVLQGNLRAIIDGVYPLETNEIAGLYDQTRVLNRLVNDLHELSQAEAQQLPLNVQQIDTQTFIERIAATFESVAEVQQIELKAEVAPGLPFISGDPTRLSQVLNNLLDNALTHTPAGGRIVIGARQLAETVVICVKDTGGGITYEHLPYVFERFYRTDKARSRHTGGSGLGLAIAKAIVEAHDGEINVRSRPNGGTTFAVTLPVRDVIHALEPLP